MAGISKILITGGSGRLGGELASCYASRYSIQAPPRAELDLSKPDELEGKLRQLDFDVLINSAAIISPDACEKAPLDAMRINAEAPAVMAAECQRRGARLIQISTDYVFGGEGDELLSESAPTRPVNAYGRSKLAAEQAVQAACSRSLVARVSWLFGGSKPSFAHQMIRQAQRGEAVEAIADKWSVPSSVTDIAEWLEVVFLHQPEIHGVLHVCNSGRATWHDYAQTSLDIAHELGMLPAAVTVKANRLDEFTGFTARRGRFTSMNHERLAEILGRRPRSWQEALRDHLQSQVRKGSA